MSEAIFDALKNKRKTANGVEADCPNCGASDRKFKAFTRDGRITGFNCFKCSFRGQGDSGLLAHFGLAKDPFHLAISELRAPSGAAQGVEEIEWPPRFIRNSRENEALAVVFIESRGVDLAIIERFDLQFTEVIEVNGRVIEYPSILAACENENGVVGWTARSIVKNDMPKALTMSGSTWKVSSVAGLLTLDTSEPVVVCEGLFSAATCQNSVALNGKVFSDKQANALKAVGVTQIILALDAQVMRSKEIDRLTDILAMSFSGVAPVEYDEKDLEKDPNDLGEEAMIELISAAKGRL